MAEDNVRVIGETFLKLGFKFDEKSYNDALQAADAAGKAYKSVDAAKDKADAVASSNKESEKGAASGDKGFIKYTQQLGGTFDKLSSEGMKILQGIFGIIKSVAGKLEEASPILQAVHQLFNLAMQLFFMPLGNKLGEVMIPAVLQMIDKALEFWDTVDEVGLTGIMEKAMTFLVGMLADYFWKLGDDIEKQLTGKDNILGSIATFLKTMSGVLRDLPGLINTGLKIMQIVLDNFGSLIGIVVAFKAASLAMQAAQLVATLLSVGGGLGLLLGVGAVAGVAAGAGMIGAGIAGSKLSNASSSYSGNNGTTENLIETPKTDTKVPDVKTETTNNYDQSTTSSYEDNSSVLNDLSTTVTDLSETVEQFNNATNDLSSTITSIDNSTQDLSNTLNDMTQVTQDLSSSMTEVNNATEELYTTTYTTKSEISEAYSNVTYDNKNLSSVTSNLSSVTSNLDMRSITSDLSSHNTTSTVNNYNIVNNGMTETQLNDTIYTVAGTTSSMSQLQR